MNKELIDSAFRIAREIEEQSVQDVFVKPAYDSASNQVKFIISVYDHVAELNYDVNDTLLLGLDWAIEHTIDCLVEVTDNLKYQTEKKNE